MPGDLVDTLRNTPDGALLVGATDGGTGFNVSTWAVHLATLTDDGHIDDVLGTWSSVLHGEDHSNWAAEAAAAGGLLRAAAHSGRPLRLHWVYDSKAVADAVSTKHAHARYGMEILLAHLAFEELDTRGATVQRAWCASHGKPFPTRWRPPPWATEATLRAVNDAADTACSRARDDYAASTGRLLISEAIETAQEWTRKAFYLTSLVSSRWHTYSRASEARRAAERAAARSAR